MDTSCLFDAVALESWIRESSIKATEDGRHIVIGYCFRSDDATAITMIVIGTRFFAEVVDIFEREYPTQFLSLARALDPSQADYLCGLHRSIQKHTFNFEGFNSNDRAQRHVVRAVLSDLFPSQWYARGFLL